MPNERTPFGGHIGDREAIVHGQRGDPVAREFDGGVEDLVLVERAAERDDHVLPGDAGREPSSQLDFDDAGHLPPGRAGGPYGRRVSPDDGRADAPHAAVHVAVAVGRDGEGVRKGVAFLDEDLMADPTTGGVEIDSLRARKGLDLGVFVQVLGRFVLDVVVERENRLPGRLDLPRSNRFEPKKKRKEGRKKSAHQTLQH